MKGLFNIYIMGNIFSFLSSLFGRGGKVTVDNSTVRSLDLERFMGRWYELARYDHSFERGMSHVSAMYMMTDSGKVLLVNEGVRNGKKRSIRGRAKQPDASQPGRLKVAFFLWFYSDYYVMDIDPDYRYALVGSSSDKYLWILSRERTITDVVKGELLSKLRARGYDTDKLIFVDQGLVSDL